MTDRLAGQTRALRFDDGDAGCGVLIIDADGCAYRGIVAPVVATDPGGNRIATVHWRSGPLWRIGRLWADTFDAGEGDGPVPVRLARIVPLETVMGAAR